MNRSFFRIPIFLYVFLFAFTLSSQLGKHYFFPFSYLSGIRIDYLAPTIYFSDIMAFPIVMYAIYQIVHRFPSLKNWIFKNKNLLFFIFSLLIVNSLFSLSKPIWWYGFARLVEFVLILLFFKKNGQDKLIYVPVVWGLLVGGCFELFLSLLQLSARHSIQGWWWYLGERNFSIFTPGIAKAYFMGKEFLRSYGTFSHPNSMAGFYLLVYSFVLTQKRITHFFIKTCILIISSFLIIISFSRTAIVSYAFINVLYFFKNSFTCRVCFIAKIIFAFALLLFAFNTTGDLNSLQKRNDFVQKSIQIISQKPFSGTGIGSYLIAQHAYPQKFSTFFEQPVHNIFLLASAQLGIPLSMLLFTLIIRIIRVKVKHIWFLLPLLGVVLTGLFDHYWITLQQNVLVSSVIFGILFSYEKAPARA